MSDKFKIFPVSEDLLPFGSANLGHLDVGRLAIKDFSNPDGSPLVLTTKDISSADLAVILEAKDIVALSFDGERWWGPSLGEAPSETGRDNNPGESMRQFAQDLAALTSGTLTQVDIEQSFSSQGMPHQDTIQGSSEWTDYPGEAEPGWTDDPGEEE